MRIKMGSYQKLQAVLDFARLDPAFQKALRNDVFATLQSGRIDLSPGELMALVDVVHGTKLSALTSELEPLRKEWSALSDSDDRKE